MSRIASFDWPDAWPELFTLLIEALQSMNPNVIHGGMRVFAGKMKICSLHIKLFEYTQNYFCSILRLIKDSESYMYIYIYIYIYI